MYRFLVASVVVSLVLCGCGGNEKNLNTGSGPSASTQTGGDTGADVKQVALEGYVIGEPVRHANLTIYPVLSKEPRTDDRYMTLDEGLANGTVEIVEVGSADEVAQEETDSVVARVAGAVARLLDSQAAPGDPFSDEDVLPTRGAEQTDGQSNLSQPLPSLVDEPIDEVRDPAPQLAPDDDPFGAARGEAPNPPAVDDPFGEAPNLPTQQSAAQIEGGQEGAYQEEMVLPFRQESVSQGDQVNTLLIVNRGDKPLYVMPGEVIIGGSQDRTIGREFIVQNDGQPMPIDVFCVEHGRWGGRDIDDTVNALVISSTREINDPEENRAAALEAREVAETVSRGKFVASVGQLSKDARVAVVKSGDQSEVWDTVATENAKAGVESQSGAFTANYTDAEAVERFEEYIEELNDPIAGQPQVVGVIVAINGNVETADIFESTPLFQKLWPKLLKSYALDAANAADGEDALAQCPRDKACGFLNEMMACRGETVHQGQGIAVTRGDGENVFTTSVIPVDGDPSAAAMEGGVGGLGGFGGSVHASGFAH